MLVEGSYRNAILLVMAMLMAGCISHISVTKVTPGTNPRGLRYCLPEPVIIGIPKPDGSVTYSVDYIPDPDHEYAVDAWSLMASHTMNLSRSDRLLLTQADLKQDSTAVLAQLLKSAGNTGGALATEIGTQKTAQATAAATAASNVAAKSVAKAQAQAALDSAKKNLEAAQKAGNATAIASAQTALNAAELALTQADIALKGAKNPGNLDLPTASKAYGPIIYRIVQVPETGGIRLEPMVFKYGNPKFSKGNIQGQFATTTVAVSSSTGGTPSKPVLTGSILSFTQTVSDNFQSIVPTGCKLMQKGKEIKDFAQDPKEGSKKGTVIISVKSGIPAGDDYIEFVEFVSSSGQHFTNQYPFEVK
jgi:hypothetical protein